MSFGVGNWCTGLFTNFFRWTKWASALITIRFGYKWHWFAPFANAVELFQNAKFHKLVQLSFGWVLVCLGGLSWGVDVQRLDWNIIYLLNFYQASSHGLQFTISVEYRFVFASTLWRTHWGQWCLGWTSPSGLPRTLESLSAKLYWRRITFLHPPQD